MHEHLPSPMNRQLALGIQLNQEATLADFCWSHNTLLQQQLQLALNHEGEQIFYLWGSSGSGKSHLLQACCHAINQAQGTIYLPLATLKEWGPQVLEGLQDQDLICIDDVDAIVANPPWEEALFHLHNRVRDNGKSILMLTGKNSPFHSSIQLPDLRSRLSAGLVMELNELPDEDKITTLKWHAKKRGITLSEGVSRFLLNRCSRNMHDLQALLARLDEASLSAHRKITIPFVKSILGI